MDRRLSAGQQGFTYLGVMFLIILMGGAVAGAGQLWSMASQRERERELLWVGSQYARALRSYYRSSPGIAEYPKRLEDLLDDRRNLKPLRHLRRLYADPTTGSSDWALILTFDGRIAGVHSRSEQRPLKAAGFPSEWGDFKGAGRYADWQFVAEQPFMEKQGPK